MFFILSKTAAFLLLPSNFLIALGVAGVLLMATRWKRAGIRVAVASLILLAFVFFLPVGDLLARPLEDRFPRWDESRGAPDGVIVLGGQIGDSRGLEPVVAGDGAHHSDDRRGQSSGQRHGYRSGGEQQHGKCYG